MTVQILYRPVAHPGCWIKREFVGKHHLDLTNLAKHIGISRPALKSLLDGEVEMSAKLAIAFEKAFGVDAAMLCEMQKNYSLSIARLYENNIRVKPFEIKAGL